MPAGSLEKLSVNRPAGRKFFAAIIRMARARWSPQIVDEAVLSSSCALRSLVFKVRGPAEETKNKKSGALKCRTAGVFIYSGQKLPIVEWGGPSSDETDRSNPIRRGLLINSHGRAGNRRPAAAQCATVLPPKNYGAVVRGQTKIPRKLRSFIKVRWPRPMATGA